MPELSQEQFLKEYSRAVADGNAAMFIGAGMSVGSDMVDWRGLLRLRTRDAAEKEPQPVHRVIRCSYKA